MSIRLQGMWLVKVRSRNASYPQQFRIDGALTGNGIYNGVTSTPEVFVNGDSWSITILNNPGAGFVPSEMQIKFPVSSGGFYSFDIESNDAGGDEDFDDLVITCRTPITPDDYLIYGNVGYYSGHCFNPCFQRYIVVDTLHSLQEAMKNAALRALISDYYPSQVAGLQQRANAVALNPQPLPPGQEPDFTPLVIPLAGTQPIPPKQRLLVRSTASSLDLQQGDKKSAKDKTESFSYRQLTSAEALPETSASLFRTSLSDSVRQEAISVAGRFKLLCETGPLPNAVLRVQEYDRSAAELAGAPYSGLGERELQGTTICDRNGNYIFRVRMTGAKVSDEILNDTAAGESAGEQTAPDVLLQLMCPGIAVPAFETAPHWNIGHLYRINICVPKSKSCLIPLACDGVHIIQGVGNIALAEPSASGARIGGGNYLGSDGLITAFGSGAPAARCAAWYGTLQLRGCLKNPAVKFYRLSYRAIGGSLIFTPFTQPFSLPFDNGVTLIEKQVFSSTANAYINVETASDPTGVWLHAFRNIKARINTAAFTNGPYLFRIEGFDASLNPVAGTIETVPLYFDNASVQARLDPEINMEGVGTLGECALFTLPVSGGATVENPGITVRYRAVHNFGGSTGFMNSYGLSMMKGSGGFSFTPTVAPAIFTFPPFLDATVNSGRNYVHGDHLSCIRYFRGTVNETGADSEGYVTATLRPASGGWLLPDQQFCAFGVSLGYQLRLTNGESLYPSITAGTVLIGIQRP
ncbi:hypothetical protein [Chitinophaga sp. YIM B06452]|uniref:hypothetical protein n=1 Tax=Chitinophaga sp. YIM B06452 TaxID=3082158 RepID=UPI0031FEFE83